MGRLSRKRKIKAVDPFCKRSIPSTDKREFDLAPKGVDTLDEPTSGKRILKVEDIKRRAARTKSRKAAAAPEIKRNAGETFSQFARRVNENTQQQLKKSMITKGSTVNAKRKKYLEFKNDYKKSKQRQKRYGSDDEVELKDTIGFGERVEAPPKLAVKPRPPKTKVNRHEAAVMASVGLAGVTETVEEPIDEADPMSKEKQLQRIKDAKLKEIEAYRSRVLAAYKDVKKTRADSKRK